MASLMKAGVVFALLVLTLSAFDIRQLRDMFCTAETTRTNKFGDQGLGTLRKNGIYFEAIDSAARCQCSPKVEIMQGSWRQDQNKSGGN